MELKSTLLNVFLNSMIMFTTMQFKKIKLLYCKNIYFILHIIQWNIINQDLD